MPHWNEEEVEDFEKDAHGLLDRMLAAKRILTYFPHLLL
jgi:hypothetical protein